MKEALKTHNVEEDKVDFINLKEATTVNVEKGWTSQHVLDIIFELTGKQGKCFDIQCILIAALSHQNTPFKLEGSKGWQAEEGMEAEAHTK